MADQEKIAKWREEVRQLGKYYFEVQDMLRLGFLKLSPAHIENLKAKLADLQKINTRLQELRKELEGIEDITPIIQEIRKNRIERVRAARAIRKVEKAEEAKQRQAEILEKRKNTPSYWGDALPVGWKFDNTDTAKLESLELPVLQNLADISEMAALTREDILWLAYHRQVSDIDHYNRFQIPKRRGGSRSISAPKPKMRKMQEWILGNILTKVPIHAQAMAFRREHSIVNNAQPHLEQALVLRLDLKDFFPSITFPRVFGLFKSFGYSEGIAAVLALICTDAWRFVAKTEGKLYHVALGKRSLPQGAITSPSISNLVARRLDNRLHKLAQAMGWVYTRYADDIVFSCSQSQVGEESLKSLMGLSKKIISEEHFEINKEKTMLMRPHQRQSATGIVLNHSEPRISRRDLRNFRAFLHQVEQKGLAQMSQIIGKDAEQYGRGYWAFVNMVNPVQAQKIAEKNPWLRS